MDVSLHSNYNIDFAGFSISKTYIKNHIFIYLCGILMILIPACISPTGNLASIGFLIGSAFVVLMSNDINSLSFFYLIVFINSSLAEMPVIGTSVTITSLLNLYYIFMFFINIKRISALRKCLVPFSFFMLWIVYLVLNAYLCNTSIFRAVWNGVPIFVAVILQCLVLKEKKYQIQLLISVFVSALVVCGLGYVELLIGRTFFYSLWKGTFYRFGILRVGSTLADANFLCLIDITLFFIIKSNVVKKLIGKNMAFILSVAIAMQVILSVSRTGILTLFLCLMIEFLCEKRRWILVIMPAIGIAVVLLPILLDFVFSLDLTSTEARLYVMSASIDYWKMSPIIGQGANSFFNESKKLVGNEIGTMNVYLNQLVSYGLIGLAFYIINIILGLRKAIVNVLYKSVNKVDACLLSGVLGWLLMSFSLDTFPRILAWAIPAIAISMYDLSGYSYK